jgi:type VI secretion system protein ImpE
MDAAELYRAGQLQRAIEAATAAVKEKPADLVRRGFLAELLCIVGNFDRADAQLEIVGNQQPKAVVGVSLLRQLIRAARSRQEFFAAGRVPDVLKHPSDSMRLRLEAWAVHRSGDHARAAELLQAAEAARPAAAGQRNGAPFADLRDLDDLLAGVVEVMTSTGKYYWVPIEHVVRLAPRKPERPIDLLWLPAEMSVRGGPDGVVYLPCVYGDTPADAGDTLLLGRATEWIDGPGGVVRGRGQRMFLVGDQDLSILDLGELVFADGSSSE